MSPSATTDIAMSVAILLMVVISWYRTHLHNEERTALVGQVHRLSKELVKLSSRKSWTETMQEAADETKSKLEDLTIMAHQIRMLQSGELELPNEHPLVGQVSRQIELERYVREACAAHSRMIKEIRS